MHLFGDAILVLTDLALRLFDRVFPRASSVTMRSKRQSDLGFAGVASAPPIPAPATRANVRRDRKAASEIDSPAPAPAPPILPAPPPITASTATAASGAALPGANTSSNPPPIPPTTPATPPPMNADAHRVAAMRAARRSRSAMSAAPVAAGAGAPRIGTAPAFALSQRVSRSSARASPYLPSCVYTRASCARLRSAAHGGQTLLSQITYELVRDSLQADATVQDLRAFCAR